MLHAGAFGRGREPPRRFQLEACVAAPARHAVDQVVGGMHTLQRSIQPLWFMHIAAHSLHGRQPAPAGKTLRLARQCPHAVAALEQPRDQPPGDIAVGTGNEAQFGCHLMVSVAYAERGSSLASMRARAASLRISPSNRKAWKGHMAYQYTKPKKPRGS